MSASAPLVVIPVSKDELVRLAKESTEQLQKQLPKTVRCMVVISDENSGEYSWGAFISPGLLRAILKKIFKKELMGRLQ